MRTVALAFCLIGACAPFPQIAGVDASQAANAPYPDLVPVETILARAPEQATPDLGNMNARLSALRARAVGLRGPVIDGATRARMARGVAG